MEKINLKPGERELARTPPRWVAWAAVLVTLALPLSVLLLFYFDDDGRMRESWTWLYMIGGATAVQLPLLSFLLRWRIMVTDRRVLIRHGLLRRELKEITRDSIESARQDGFMIRIDGGGQVNETYCHPFSAGRIMSAIDPDRAARAHPAGMLGGLLEPGEEMLLRSKSPLPMALATFALAILSVASGYYGQYTREGGWGDVDFGFLFGMPAAGAVLGAALMFAIERGQKKWMITGRRILTVQGVFRRRVEEIPLDRIDGTAFDGETVTVRGGGDSLDIALGEVREDGLHRVLGRWFPWRGEPSAPAEALLRDGEAIRLRRPRRLLAALGIGAPLAFVAGLVGFLGWYMPEDGFDFGFLFAVLPIVAAMLLFSPLFIKTFAWTLLVTDRRVLLRRPHDHDRYDDLALDAIEEIHPIDKHNPRVVLRGPDRDYRFPTSSAKAANLIRETIESAKGEARWRA